MFVGFRLIEDFVAAVGGDSLIDWRLAASMDNTGYEVVFGDTMIVKWSVTGRLDCLACLSPLKRTKGTSTPEMFGYSIKQSI